MQISNVIGIHKLVFAIITQLLCQIVVNVLVIICGVGDRRGVGGDGGGGATTTPAGGVGWRGATTTAVCPNSSWNDSSELCKLWAQIQTLSATVNALTGSAANGKRSRRSLTSQANYQDMTSDEQETIVALIDAYKAIIPCCYPSMDCNGVAIKDVFSRIRNS